MLAQSSRAAGESVAAGSLSPTHAAGGRKMRLDFLARFLYASCLCALLGIAAVAVAQTGVAPAPAEPLTIEAVENRLKQGDTLSGADDETKAKIRETLQQAIKDLEAAKRWAATAEQFEKLAQAAPDDLMKTQEELSSLPSEPEISIPTASLAQLEQRLSQKAGKLAAEEELQKKLEEEMKLRATRRVEVPKLIVEIRERLSEVEKQLQSPAAEAPSELDTARQWALAARREALSNELRSHEKELDACEKRVELLPLRRDLAARRVALDKQELAAWREAVNRQRGQEAEAQLRLARAAAAQAHPAIKGLMEQNARLAERRKELAQRIVQTTAEQAEVNSQLSTLRDQFERTRKKVEALGRTDTIGALLRKERDKMSDPRVHRKHIKDRQTAIGECQYNLIELEDRRSVLSNIEAEIRKHLKTARLDDFDGDRAELEAAAREALETEKEYVDALVGDLTTYSDKLTYLNTDEEQLTKQTAEYMKYIDERVLWIHSTSPLGTSSFGHLAEAAAWLTRPEQWLRLGSYLVEDVTHRPLLAMAALLVFGALVWNLPRLRRKTSEIGAVAGRTTCSSIVPTFEALSLMALMSCAAPGLLWYVAWRLRVEGNASELADAVSAGLVYTAGIHLLLSLMQQMCRPGGLSESHFDWPASALKPVRNYVRVATISVLPFVFVTVTMAAQTDGRLDDSLGRLAFVVVMATCAALVQRSLRYHGGIYQAMLAAHRDGLLDRLRMLWYPLAVFVPSALAVLAATGYYYTAQQLAGRMVATVCILFVLVLVRSLLMRWVLVYRRHLAMEQARQRRAAAAADAKSTDEAAGTSEMPAPAVPTLDLATINVQTRNLVKYSLALAGFLGIWVVWVDVLPALGILDRIPLWSAAGQTEPTSLADLILAVVAFAPTLVATRNAPALLELALLQRSKLDASVRYTVATVLRYVIIVVGLLVGCHILGLRWGTVQWLVAAVSVGLGFGLQEIFANFVSGIIILFEQPVRVGDIVTVDNTTGVVSRIRMRATTITNWDRQEFIVPNKEFITGRLLNWTLSDQVNRVVVRVGIAYGSDTQLATELLTKIVREHPLILNEPAPRVTFEEFGDSALNYVVRCYLPDMENRLAVIHDLHTSIDREFREAGIEIAFPQQDVHIRSLHASIDLLRQLAGNRRRGPGLVHPENGDEQPHARHVA